MYIKNYYEILIYYLNLKVKAFISFTYKICNLYLIKKIVKNKTARIFSYLDLHIMIMCY